MNEYALYHRTESNYCYPTSKDEITIRIRVCKDDDISKIYLIYGCKYDFYAVQHQKEMKIRYEDNLYKYYEVNLILKDVRLTYIFKILSKGKIYYYSEDGLSSTYDFKLNFYNCFQYAYIHESDVHKMIDFMRKGVFYEIFVDRFKIGNKNKDMSYINMKWNGKPTPKSFAGGDLEGVISNLNYLKRLGVNGLYLTPIFKSISNHKYDIEDYFEIDKQFGDEETLKRLVKIAHEKKMKVVLDAVFNHISDRSYFFQDAIKYKKQSKYYDWFIFDDKGDYECFSVCKYMPKLNTDNTEVQDYLIKVGKYYIQKFDIDGWRLDVSDEVSHSFWKRFRKELKEVKEDIVLIGENWHDANKYLQGDEFDSIMNYAFTKALLDYLAFNKYSSKQMSEKLNSLLIRNTEQVNRMMLNLMDTHDTLRFYTEINKDLDRYLIALSLLYFYDGVPCLYYGDESLMEGGYDPDSRRGFKKDTSNAAYKLIIELSKLKKNNGFANSKLYVKEENDLLILERIASNCTYRLVINIGNEKKYLPNDILLSNNFNVDIIDKYGFVIERRIR